MFDQQKGSSKTGVKKSNKPVRSLSQKAPKSASLSVAPAQENGTALPAVSTCCGLSAKIVNLVSDILTLWLGRFHYSVLHLGVTAHDLPIMRYKLI